jgi:hypothetical protein
MFTLLNPAALLALLGLLVPVAIHLWNRRPGREIAVGSLRWLAAGANRRLRNLKLEQFWLLLLRAALLAVLAVAMAGPVWRTALPTSRGVVLLSPEAVGLPALAGLKNTVDSLRRRGYVLRWLAAGFPRVSGSAWRQLPAGTAGAAADSLAASASSRASAFAWARVQQAVDAFPGQPLLVLTSAALRNFGGSHSPLPAAVRWQALPDSSTAAWVGAAALAGDSLHLLVGRSTENRTTYQRKTVLKPRSGQSIPVPGLGLMREQSVAGGGMQLSRIPAGKTLTINDINHIDVEPKVLEIYASPQYATDARYLEAGLRAAAAGLLSAAQLRRVAVRPAQLQAQWTFWLSDEPLPPNWQRDLTANGLQLWREAAAQGIADTARLATLEAAVAAVMVFRRSARSSVPGLETVWADGRGRAILSRQRLGRGSVLQLYTRLNPAWSELADDPQLPARLLELLQPEYTDNSGNPPTQLATTEAAHDHRALAPAQLSAAPVRAASASTAPTSVPTLTFRTTDLRPWLVLLAGLLLLAERLLARRRESLTPPAITL